MKIFNLDKIFIFIIFFSVNLIASNEAFLLIKLKYEKAENNYNVATDKCMKIENKNKLSAKDFETLRLSKEQYKSALFFLSSTNFDRCTRKEKDRYSTISNEYINIGKYYKKDVREVIGMQKAIFGYSWQKINIELSYLKLPKELRDFFESNSKLKKPFDIVQAFEVIEKADLFFEKKLTK